MVLHEDISIKIGLEKTTALTKNQKTLISNLKMKVNKNETLSLFGLTGSQWSDRKSETKEVLSQILASVHFAHAMQVYVSWFFIL